MAYQIRHPRLGKINGCQVTQDLIQFRSLPYAQVPRRFARSVPLEHLPQDNADETSCYDATEYGPCSVQPRDSIATDVRWNQLPEFPRREQDQSENCLRITLTCPAKVVDDTLNHLPVVVFVHGGALMVGSGTYLQCNTECIYIQY